jgi:hypothetical protein
MTPLTKPVSRKTGRDFMHYGKKLIATLEPGDILAMRLERDGDKQTYRLSLHTLLQQAMLARANTNRRE